MFLRAGYNQRFKTVAVGLGAFGPVYLLRWQCGDHAWLCPRRGLTWKKPWLRDLIDGPPVHVGLEQSRLPE